MTTTRRRKERQEWNPDLGVLAIRFLFSLQDELFERLAEGGYDDLQPRHSAVLAYLDEDGVRATELARLSGRQKQIVGRIVDELEELDYVERRPDPRDRRAKLIFPTERGLAQVRLGDEIIADIEARHSREVGARTYGQFRDVLRGVVARRTQFKDVTGAAPVESTQP
ncbi:MAG TPA: helix-turn-helix domain-containing protein [Solirubrobacterales bacterium]|nr:helix-turn-helix domain-containing protein [Solirubrobacterales bacterium]